MADPSYALVVIDVQNDFVHPEGASGKRGRDVAACQACVPNIIRTIERCRVLGVPVIFVRSEYGEWTDSPVLRARRRASSGGKTPSSMCAAGTWGAEFYGVTPAASDRVIVKRRYNAFIGTDLELTLRAKGVDTVLFCGVTSDVCVDTTARDAFMRDFDPIVLEDCTAAYFDDAHEAALRAIRRSFGRVMSSDEALTLVGAAPAALPS